MKILKTLLLSVTLFLSGLTNISAASITDTGLTVSSSVCTDTLANLTTQGCSSGGGSGTPFIQITSFDNIASGGGINNIGSQNLVNVPYLASKPYSENGTSGSWFYNIPIGMTIGHLMVNCASYNAADVAQEVLNGSISYAPVVSQYTPLNAAGLGGGTVNFYIINATHSITSNPLLIGSVVLPTSPQAGPYITSASSVVSPSYTILQNDNMVLSVTSVSSAAQTLLQCLPYIGV
jgi:hypothetical protein